MLDKIQELVKQYGGDMISSTPEIPNDKTGEVLDVASNSIWDGLKSAVTSGKIGEVKDLLSGSPEAAENSPITQNVQQNFMEGLTQKIGLDSGMAMKIATAMIPMLIKKFVTKTSDPNEKGFDISDILGSLGGGGISDMLGNLTGGDEKKEGGGLMDTIKGMFN